MHSPQTWKPSYGPEDSSTQTREKATVLGTSKRISYATTKCSQLCYSIFVKRRVLIRWAWVHQTGRFKHWQNPNAVEFISFPWKTLLRFSFERDHVRSEHRLCGDVFLKKNDRKFVKFRLGLGKTFSSLQLHFSGVKCSCRKPYDVARVVYSCQADKYDGALYVLENFTFSLNFEMSLKSLSQHKLSRHLFR